MKRIKLSIQSTHEVEKPLVCTLISCSPLLKLQQEGCIMLLEVRINQSLNQELKHENNVMYITLLGDMVFQFAKDIEPNQTFIINGLKESKNISGLNIWYHSKSNFHYKLLEVNLIQSVNLNDLKFSKIQQQTFVKPSNNELQFYFENKLYNITGIVKNMYLQGWIELEVIFQKSEKYLLCLLLSHYQSYDISCDLNIGSWINISFVFPIYLWGILRGFSSTIRSRIHVIQTSSVVSAQVFRLNTNPSLLLRCKLNRMWHYILHRFLLSIFGSIHISVLYEVIQILETHYKYNLNSKNESCTDLGDLCSISIETFPKLQEEFANPLLCQKILLYAGHDPVWLALQLPKMYSVKKAIDISINAPTVIDRAKNLNNVEINLQKSCRSYYYNESFQTWESVSDQSYVMPNKTSMSSEPLQIEDREVIIGVLESLEIVNNNLGNYTIICKLMNKMSNKCSNQRNEDEYRVLMFPIDSSSNDDKDFKIYQLVKNELSRLSYKVGIICLNVGIMIEDFPSDSKSNLHTILHCNSCNDVRFFGIDRDSKNHIDLNHLMDSIISIKSTDSISSVKPKDLLPSVFEVAQLFECSNSQDNMFDEIDKILNSNQVHIPTMTKISNANQSKCYNVRDILGMKLCSGSNRVVFGILIGAVIHKSYCKNNILYLNESYNRERKRKRYQIILRDLSSPDIITIYLDGPVVATPAFNVVRAARVGLIIALSSCTAYCAINGKYSYLKCYPDTRIGACGILTRNEMKSIRDLTYSVPTGVPTFRDSFNAFSKCSPNQIPKINILQLASMRDYDRRLWCIVSFISYIKTLGVYLRCRSCLFRQCSQLQGSGHLCEKCKSCKGFSAEWQAVIVIDDGTCDAVVHLEGTDVKHLLTGYVCNEYLKNQAYRFNQNSLKVSPFPTRSASQILCASIMKQAEEAAELHGTIEVNSYTRYRFKAKKSLREKKENLENDSIYQDDDDNDGFDICSPIFKNDLNNLSTSSVCAKAENALVEYVENISFGNLYEFTLKILHGKTKTSKRGDKENKSSDEQLITVKYQEDNIITPWSCNFIPIQVKSKSQLVLEAIHVRMIDDINEINSHTHYLLDNLTF